MVFLRDYPKEANQARFRPPNFGGQSKTIFLQFLTPARPNFFIRNWKLFCFVVPPDVRDGGNCGIYPDPAKGGRFYRPILNSNPFGAGWSRFFVLRLLPQHIALLPNPWCNITAFGYYCQFLFLSAFQLIHNFFITPQLSNLQQY